MKKKTKIKGVKNLFERFEQGENLKIGLLQHSKPKGWFIEFRKPNGIYVGEEYVGGFFKTFWKIMTLTKKQK